MVYKTEDDNPELLEYIESHKDKWAGPTLIEETFIKRTVGPEAEMLNFESESEFKVKVDEILKWLANNPGHDLNLLCELNGNTYYLLDGNHRFEALKKLGHTQFSIIFTRDKVLHNLINAKH